MRTFDERKTEIFRRSEKRIRERKRNRKRILSLCIPLCLLLVWSLFALPPVFSRKDKNMIPEEGMDVVGSTDLKGGTYIQVESFLDENELLSDDFKTSAEKAEGLRGMLASFLFPEEEYENFSDHDGADSSESKKENSAHTNTLEKAFDYRIAFVKDGKESEVYTLKGNILTEEKTKKSVLLTEDQRALILEEIGLE